jgi:glycine dehydrogenase subunit 1
MDFVSNQKSQIEAMLKALGIDHIEELFSELPKHLKLPPPSIDDGLSEYEGMGLIENIAAKNTFPQFESYLGGGAYEHHIPALTQAICAKSEFLTSYTPYQAEASQGMLQATFEFQSAMCALTGMDVSNASLYDGATACAEAMLMTLRCHKDRNKILIAKSLHPHYQSVVEQYVSSHKTKIEWIPFTADGKIDQNKALQLIDDKTAGILISYPNFFGVVDDLTPLISAARSYQVLSVLCANPLVYGLYASAGELGVDIAVGDAQPLGLPLQYGGPYVGYMCCRQEYVRQMPGRIVGETTDKEKRRGFVLTLQAREQHIRREKATSNICTNQALAALASLVTILWYGKEGIAKLALTNYQRTAYLKNALQKIPGITIKGDTSHFNEFIASFEAPIDEVVARFRKEGIEPGIDLGRFYPEFKNSLLIAVTETKSKAMLDRYAKRVIEDDKNGF